jgi:GNAT superfamily N-acetyltransferase
MDAPTPLAELPSSTGPALNVVEIDLADSAAVDRLLVAGAVVQGERVYAIVEDLGATLRALDPAGPLLHTVSARGFVVETVDGQAIGRCVAVVASSMTGFITLWECTGGPSVESTLLASARSWLETHHCVGVCGPVSMTASGRPTLTSELPGVLCDDATEGSPTAWLAAGFGPALDVTAMVASCDAPRRHEADDPGADYSIRGLRQQHVDAAVADMQRLCEADDTAWAWPRAGACVEELITRLGHLLAPELIRFAITGNGELVGYAIAYPDHAHLARELDGDWSALGRRRLARLRRPQRAVLHSVVVHPRHRGRGVATALAASVLDVASRARYREVIALGVPTDPSEPANAVAQRLGFVPVGTPATLYAQTAPVAATDASVQQLAQLAEQLARN